VTVPFMTLAIAVAFVHVRRAGFTEKKRFGHEIRAHPRHKCRAEEGEKDSIDEVASQAKGRHIALRIKAAEGCVAQRVAR
jgi:hypothetical protein